MRRDLILTRMHQPAISLAAVARREVREVVPLLHPRPIGCTALRFAHIALLATTMLSSLASAANRSEAVEWPEFAAAEGQPSPARENWRYARTDAFEIISELPDGTTRASVRELMFVHAFIASICAAPDWEARYAQPCLAVFHAEKNKGAYLEFLGPSDAVLAERVQRPTAVSSRKFLRGREQTAMVHLGDFYEHPYSSGAAIVHNVFQQFSPRPPVWVRVAVGNLMRLMDPDVFWEPYVALIRTDLQLDLRPMQAMFDQTLPPPHALTINLHEPTHTEPLSPWHHQVTLFVHFALWGDGGRHRPGFVRFVHRTCTEPASEELFQECFAMDYAQAMQRLRDYVTTYTHRSVDLPAVRRKILAGLSRVSLQPAAPANVARLKAEAKLMSGHAEAAHRDLVAAYRRGGTGARDPQLCGALGLREAEAGRHERARPLLEFAAATGVRRAMVHLELARLRHAEVMAAGRPPGGFSRERFAPVLALLHTARTLNPPFVEAYRLHLDILGQTGGGLTPEDHAMMADAVRLFPQDAALRHVIAELQGRPPETIRASGS